MGIHINNIKQVEEELKRFTKKLALTKQRYTNDKIDESFSGCKETGALKRGAQDLKRCLTDNLT